MSQPSAAFQNQADGAGLVLCKRKGYENILKMNHKKFQYIMNRHSVNIHLFVEFKCIGFVS